MIREHLLKLRQMILKASSSLSDDDAYDVPELFKRWKPGIDLELGERVEHKGRLYRVEQAHMTQTQYTPDIVPALYTWIAKPGEILPWRQPTGSQDAYRIDAKVHYPTVNDPIYINKYDYNIYAPDVYGWEVWVP